MGGGINICHGNCQKEAGEIQIWVSESWWTRKINDISINRKSERPELKGRCILLSSRAGNQTGP
jgi:hypothetical protein